MIKIKFTRLINTYLLSSLPILCVGLLMMSCSVYPGAENGGAANNGAANGLRLAATDTSLKLKDQVPFPLGAALNINHLRNRPGYRALVIQEFNSITAENCMKPSKLHPAPNTYTWDDADYLVNFAVVNNIRVHGHTLIWHHSLPTWIEEFRGTKDEWDTLLKTHIQTIVKHFKGKVSSWDVVNEAFNDNGSYRKTVWYNNLGKDYIAKAFIYAHEADPNAKLFYNDYGHEYNAKKRNAIIKMLADLKSAGIPVHGIGMQTHTNIDRPVRNFAVAIDAAVATGLLVHISELDVAVNRDDAAAVQYTTALIKKQGGVYSAIFKAYMGVPAAQQYGVTFWNVSDGDTFRSAKDKKQDYPLLFDKDYKKKEVYRSVISTIKGN